MSRNAFWVILAGNTPTSFRSSEREALLPTLRQLQRTQPNVTLQWFERSRLWVGPEEARAALQVKRQERRPHGPDWRPGGTHEDPRAKYDMTRDQKRARFKRRSFGPPRSADPSRPSPPSRPPRPPRPEDTRRPPRDSRPDDRPPDRGDGPRSPRGPSSRPSSSRPSSSRPVTWSDKPRGPKGRK